MHTLRSIYNCYLWPALHSYPTADHLSQTCALNPMHTHPRDSIIIDYPLCPVFSSPSFSHLNTKGLLYNHYLITKQDISFDKKFTEFRFCLHLLFSCLSQVSLSPSQSRFCPLLHHQMFLPGWPPCFYIPKPRNFQVSSHGTL